MTRTYPDPVSSRERPATLITGGSRGIGAAIARRLAREGHDLALTYRERRADAEAVAVECRGLGAQVVLLEADLADLDRAAQIVAEAVVGLGRLTGLVNNAGITGRIGPFLETTTAEYELVFRVNVLAPLVITRTAVAELRTRGGGSIVNISSGAASTGAPHTYIPYAMSKAALNLLTVGAAKEFASQGVRINTVSPGTTYTEIHAAAGRPNAPAERAPGLPMGRAAQPEEIVGAVAYLLSDDASYTSGAEIKITGG
ncbi:SDR family oxidoreductase [Microlunatus aurantiacus]|uniref:SDR family oxidoreductase n=1 Tax=Microlunatus aurantiacus TaxID=446786 RepID=A0ABP7CXC2_9ACTN